MKLEDAISAVMLHASSGMRMNVFEKELRLLVCAARAFSCDECGGTGRVRVAVADWEGQCDVCRSDRAEIKVYG